MRSRLIWLVAGLGILGCARQPDLMPLSVGRSSTYEITYGLEKHVEPIVVTREIPIAGAMGFEMGGTMGVSRLVWKNGELLASQTANATFDPPIPLLTTDMKGRTWNGRLSSMGTKSLGSATLTQSNDKVDVGTRTIASVLSVLTIKLPKGEIVVNSWFQPGVGLIRQEQRTNDQLLVRMELLGTPKG